MKSKICLSFVLFLMFFFTNGQTTGFYYYYRGEKVPLRLDKSKATLFVTTDFEQNSILMKGIKFDKTLTESSTNILRKYLNIDVLSESNTDSSYLETLSLLENYPKIIKAQPSFLTNENVSIGMSSYFYVTLRSVNDLPILEQTAKNMNVEVIGEIPYLPLCYVLLCTKETKGNTLSVANYFYETGLFKYSVPDFLSDDTKCSEDPMFNQLWGLKNINNPNIDINICDAWAISKGNNVKIGVLDTGIQKTHLDLSQNISSISYNTETNTNNSIMYEDHGTHVAGIIGAVKNNIQVVGVAPESTMIDISNSLSSTPNSRIKRAAGINWAVLNGVDIINNSWGSSVAYDEITDAINNAINNGRNGKGTIVVFATGNNNGAVSYPANSNPNIIAVGSITSSGNRSSFSNYGKKIDIVAPGSDILSTLPNNMIGYKNGTSMATPHVAGVAALILSVNPNLTVTEVADIIEQTAQKVGNYNYGTHNNKPNGTWNIEMGYGLVDAYAAVLKAKETLSSDLYIKDNLADTGIEPNTTIENFWESPDIWVRNNNDSGTEHQNPVYKANGQPNFIKIRVRNRGGQTSTGYEQLAVNWAKASIALSGNTPWNGGVYQNGNPNAVMGGVLDTIYIPQIAPNQEHIITIPWVVPNPYNYTNETTPWGDFYDRWHFCLLAKIIADNDPMHTPLGENLGQNVLHNNNVVQKNISVNNFTHTPNKWYGGAIAVGNFTSENMTIDVNFGGTSANTADLLTQGELLVYLDETTHQKWKIGGYQSIGIRKTAHPRVIQILEPTAAIKNLKFGAKEFGLIDFTVNFLTQNVTQNEFTYVITQTDGQGNLIGGETYEIKRSSRHLFTANADNQQVNKDEPITLNAENINEEALYNWYDQEGNLIHEGTDFTTSVSIAQTYKLEIIALNDGYKDYKDVAVSLKPNHIVAVYPNPVQSVATVHYKINDGQTAYLSLVGVYGVNTVNNYILNTDDNQITLDFSNLSPGVYVISLISNGKITDSQTIIKQ